MWIVCLDSRFSHHLFFEQTQCFIHFSAESSRAKEKGNDPTKYFAIDRNRIVMKRNSGMVVRWPGVQSIVSIVPLSIRCNEDVDDQNVVGIPFARSRSTSSASHFRWFEIIERVWLRSKYRRYVPLQSQGPGAFLFPNVFLRIMVMISNVWGEYQFRVSFSSFVSFGPRWSHGPTSKINFLSIYWIPFVTSVSLRNSLLF